MSCIGPAGIERVVQDCRPDGNHALGTRTRPAHAGPSQLLFELLDIRFNTSRANRKPSLLKIQVVHARLVGFKIMGLFRQASLVQVG